ncbi:MAG: hypothetical protein JW829_05890 [Pirellulales bacterium]|nr:hypothetical protein [Pirellulales bacterium]
MKHCILTARWVPWFILVSAALARAEPADQPVEENGQYLLRYRFEMGEVVRYAVEHAADIRMTMKGTSQSTKAHSESTKAWKVLDVLPTGEIEFSHVVENIHMRNESPDRAAMEYDSRKGEVVPPGYEQVAAAVGVTLTVVRIKPNGKIISYEQKHPQIGNLEDAPMVTLLPEESVPVGAEWNEAYHVNVDVGENQKKRIETRRHFKLADVKNGIATIEVNYQVLSPIDATIEAQLVGRLTTGKIRFDLARGRISSQQLDVDKHIIGFAGPSSSMHYLSRFTERLLPENQEITQMEQEGIAK